MAKGWTEERRRQQAERCRQNKPWTKSTGPRTAEGKARSSMNAFKTGYSTHIRKLMSDMERAHREFIKGTMLLHYIELDKDALKQALIIEKILKSQRTERRQDGPL